MAAHVPASSSLSMEQGVELIMRSYLSTIVVLCASSLWCVLSPSAWGAIEIADAIYLNGRIFTSRCTASSMGHQFPLSLAIPVRGPPTGEGQGTGNRLPGHFYTHDPEGRLPINKCQHRRCHVDTTIRMVRHTGRAKSQSERGPIHLHIRFLDGVYVYRDDRPPRFQRVKAPDKGELEDLLPRAWFS
jgi:hypothetical protein